MFICHLNIFFPEIYVQIVCPFLNQVVSFLIKSSLYILASGPLSVVLQRFSPSLWLVFSFY